MLLKPLSIATLAVLFSLMFIGGYVSSSGVGLSCPNWPLCPAGLVPMKEFVIEYIHRTVAAGTGLLVLATMAFTLQSKLTSRNVKIISVVAATLVLGQIVLGGIVIVEKLHAVLVTIHLGMGLVLFAMVLVVARHVYQLDKMGIVKMGSGAGSIEDRQLNQKSKL
jgi:cytochrome c oxidase assembly protein subunit 15